MNQRHERLANQVLTAFRASLDAAAEQQIGEANFRRLHELIRDALSQELDDVTTRMEALLQELRTEIEKPELEL